MTSPEKITAREAAFTVLLQTEREAAYTNLALKKYLDRHPLSPADARLAAQIVYGTARMKIALDHIISRLLTRPDAKLMTEARVILRLSLFHSLLPPCLHLHASCPLPLRRIRRIR